MTRTLRSIRPEKKEGETQNIICLWEHIVYAMFLYPEEDTADIFLGDNLKIKIMRSFDGENIHYSGLLMRNIGVLDKDDWRVATSLVKKADFSCTDELDVFDAIIGILEQLNHMEIRFYILSPENKKVLVSMKFTELG